MDEDVETGSDPILPRQTGRYVGCLKNSGFALCIFVLFICIVLASIMVSLLIVSKSGLI